MSELGTATTHLPIREALPTPFPPELITGLKQLDFENRTERVESRGLERNRPFGEEIGQFFRSGVKVKLEIATNIGLTAKEIAGRKHRVGRYGGAREIRTRGMVLRLIHLHRCAARPALRTPS